MSAVTIESDILKQGGTPITEAVEVSAEAVALRAALGLGPTATPEFAGAILTPTAGGRFLSVDAAALSTSVGFSWAINENQFVGTGEGGENYSNHVVAWGWNVNDTIGVPLVVGQHSAYFAIENKYFQGGIYGSEVHLEFYDTAGTNHRPWSYFLPINGGAGSILNHQVDIVKWLDFSGEEVMQLDSVANTIYLYSGLTISSDINNAAVFQQRNAADTTFLPLPFYGSDDRLVTPAAASFVGGTPTTGDYTTAFLALNATSLPTDGKILQAFGPNVTGNAYAFEISANPTQALIGAIYNNRNTVNSHAVIELRTIGTSSGDSLIRYNVNGGTQWQVGLDNSAGDQFVWGTDALGSADKMILDTSGNLTTAGAITLTPAASATPGTNGQLTFEATSNTTITLKLKGSDGTVRSGTVTLS